MDIIKYSIALKDLRNARERFAGMLNTKTVESDWQMFFTECPYILSESLPLKLQPTDITPLGRPGKNEADFMFLPKREISPSFFGVIELKKPDSRLFSIPRKNILRLSSDAQTAFVQGQFYVNEMEKEIIAHNHETFAIGNEKYVFIISGLKKEILEVTKNQLIKEQIKNLLPTGFRIITYDGLYEIFTSRIPPQVFFLINRTFNYETDNLTDDDTAVYERVLHQIRAKEAYSNKKATYIILIDKVKEHGFLEAMKDDGTMDLEDFGKVVASYYGDTMPPDIQKFIKEKFGVVL